MRKLVIIFILGFPSSSFAQAVLNDSLNFIYSVYQLSEFDKSKFNNPKHPKQSIFIMYKVGKNDQDKVFPNRHLKYNDINIYFYTRAYVVGFDINHWLVIDRIDSNSTKAKITCSLVDSKDPWLERFDKTTALIEIEFLRDGDRWIQTSKKITSDPSQIVKE